MIRAMLIFCLLAAALAAAGCSADAVTVRSRAFRHPSEVTFVCYDVAPASGAPIAAVPLSDCAGDDARFRLHALVTQKSRGEVAAVNLDDNAVLDSDLRVPGYTFVPVGEIPVDLVVPESDPARTYVADYGSFDIRAIDTVRFHPAAASVGTTPGIRLTLPSAPADLALGPDAAGAPEAALYVSLPDIGALAIVPLPIVTEGGTMPTIVTLGTDVPAPVAATPEPVRYCKACSGDGVTPTEPCGDLVDPYPVVGGVRQPFPPREIGVLPADPMARPVHSVLDAANNRLLVADATLPIVHVVDLAAPDVAQPPIVVGVPTEYLALTPPVPNVIGSTMATERFLYAIDATDGSVLAVRYDEATPSASAVIPTSVRGDRDRLGLRAAARVLEVITPSYPGELCDPANAEQAGDAAPLRLRGVFLAAALLDGTVQIVDVHDLDAPCRGGGNPSACMGAPSADDDVIFIQRHRSRIGARIATEITLSAPPAIETNGVTVAVENDGATDGDLSPNLLPQPDGCPQGMTTGFPFGGEEDQEPVVCVLADPWAAESETWVATWEGTLPGTEGGRARLSIDDDLGGAPVARVEIDACARGVLGAENVEAIPDTAPEASYLADLFVVTGEIPPSVPEDAGCRAPILDPDGELVLLDFPIVRAERVTRTDGEVEHVLLLASETRGGTPFATVRECFPELTGYAIRSQGAYTVIGGRTGMRHRVVADETTGLCVVDGSLPVDRIGKAIPGRFYDNSVVRFGLSETGLTRLEDAQLSFQIAQTPVELVIPIADDLPTVLSDVAFNPIDGNMYVVDTSFAGLVQLELDPVRIGLGWD